MKYVVTGSLGNISKPLAEQLVKAGHEVVVVSSNNDKTAQIEAIGAKAAIGSVDDVAFLTKTFSGADAVYTMVPPNFAAENYREFYNVAANAYATAIKATEVKRVVNLSSIGAHLSEDTGPIKGLHDLENIFNKLEGVNIKHLRAAAFYTNYLASIGMIKHAGILGDNYGSDTPIILVHPKDIATAVVEELENGFTGKSVRYVVSDELTPKEATAILGKAIGKPELPWVEFSDADALAGMLQAGLPEEIAKNFVEMGVAVRAGKLKEDFDNHKPIALAKTKLTDFAVEFAAAYNA